jgi:type II secretory pathway pseudopilin PulG
MQANDLQLAHSGEYLYARAVRAFNETEREDVHGNLLPGKATFLLVAARISLWMAKVPVHSLPVLRDDESSDVTASTSEPAGSSNGKAPRSSGTASLTEQQQEALALAMARAAAIQAAMDAHEGKMSPLVGECSPDEVSSPNDPAADVESVDVSTYAEQPCGDVAAQYILPGSPSLLTAQRGEPLKDMLPQMSGNRDQSSAGDFGRKPLNRRERRAREKLRKRLLAKS